MKSIYALALLAVLVPTVALADRGGEGNTTEQGVIVEGDTYVDESIYEYTYEDSVSSAASVFAQICVNGASAQSREYGVSIGQQDALCDSLKLAVFWWDAYVRELSHSGGLKCAEEMSISYEYDGALWMDTCVNDKAMKYLDRYYDSMDDVYEIADKTEEMGVMDRAAGFLTRPLMLLGALILLI